MSLNSLVETLNRYEAAGGFGDLQAASDPARIRQVADALDLELPAALEELFSTYDYIEYGPEETLSVNQIGDQYGLLHGLYPSLSKELLPIMVDDIGGRYVVVCVQKGQAASSETGCVLYVPSGHPAEVETRATNVISFLVSRMEMRMDGL